MAEELEEFYRKVDVSSVVFVNQPEPKGFGDAVLRARPFIEENSFFIRAIHTLFLRGHRHLTRLIKIYEELKADTMFIVQEVEDPRQYGVMEEI